MNELINREAKGVKGEGTINKSICHSGPRAGISPTLDSYGQTGKMLNQVQHDSYGNIPARSAHKGRLTLHPSPLTRTSRIHSATLGLRLALNATARACGQKRGFARLTLDSSLRSVAPLGLAFTMAEILLSLTIIGVVAAITLPSLTGNINERTWTTQRKALLSRMSQAISLMPAVNGYGVVKEETSEGAGDAVDTASETFITNGLSKVLQINNICDSDHLSDCGIPNQIITADATKLDIPKTMADLNDKMTGTRNNGIQSFSIKNTKAAAFETKNGESLVVYTNPYCVGDLQDMTWSVGPTGGAAGTLYQRTVCVNFIFDLNGKKGPNTVGKDVGVMTIMYPSDPVIVAPQPSLTILDTANFSNASNLCSNFDSEYRMPNLEENYSMFVNKKLLQPSGMTATQVWSSHRATRPNGTKVILLTTMGTGEIDDWTYGASFPTWCVKR